MDFTFNLKNNNDNLFVNYFFNDIANNSKIGVGYVFKPTPMRTGCIMITKIFDENVDWEKLDNGKSRCYLMSKGPGFEASLRKGVKSSIVTLLEILNEL